MVALGESGLRVLDYGDGPGPDSRGLFQQRDNGAWGSYEDRMDPTISATNFIKALQAVPGWEQLEPTIAGNGSSATQTPTTTRSTGPKPSKSSRHSRTANSPSKAATAHSRGSPVPEMTTPGKTLRPGCRSGLAQLRLHLWACSTAKCVDFALWRVNQQMGSTSAPFKFLNGNFRPDGQGLGSALTWKAGWDAKGWPSGKTPRVGAVVSYAPGTGGVGPDLRSRGGSQGSQDDGTYVEEGYNGNPPPDDHNYYTRTVKSSVPSAFLYLPNQEEKK